MDAILAKNRAGCLQRKVGKMNFTETMIQLLEKEAENAGKPADDTQNTEGHAEERIEENVKRVVVLGGSFNPPTIAHKELLQYAVRAVDADRGIFVPVPLAYVKRKMKKCGKAQQTLSDAARIQMLESMCIQDEETGFQLMVDDCETAGKVKGFTYETLVYISRKYPNAELYFLAGCDKLHIIPRWHRVNEFLSQFRILAAKRKGEEPEQLLEENPYLKEQKDAFVVFEIPDELDEISSSVVRELYYTGQEKGVREMITNDVYEIWKQEKPVAGPCINRFRDSYDFLSNFYSAAIEYDGLIFLNAEAAFQAQKCLTEEEKRDFCEAPANKAKRMGRNVALRNDWEEVKVSLMEDIVRCKFRQNENLAVRLLATGDIPLVEGNTWGDVFWGVDIRNGKGKNNLGKILMKIRSEMREEQSND